MDTSINDNYKSNLYYLHLKVPLIQNNLYLHINFRYRWTSNKVEFNPSGNNDRVVQLFDSGTLVFNRPEDKDEGIFQCNAINEHGTSTTINVNLRQAMLEKFPYGADTSRVVTRGHSVKLPCIPPTSIPKAEIRWVLKDTKPGGRIEAINFNNRITMDLEGKKRNFF